jgi:phenylacetic acid degradation protein paaN
MHTTGQSFIMSFQASGPHANDRALEAVALGYHELNRYPSKVIWDKPMGKFNIVLEKSYKPVPKGIGLVIGCSTFPIWNSVPGLYANLVTGNTAIVKPHPKVVLPLAIVVAEIQHTLQDNGFDPLIVQLAVDSSNQLITKQLAEHDAVKLIDYTGSTAFGNYVESLSGKTVFTEKAGVNSVILDSVEDLDAVLNNLAFSVSLYSGQMCTAPQNFFIPETGIRHGDAVISYEEVVARLKAAVEGLVQNPKMGPGTLAAIQNPATLDRSMHAVNLGGKLILEPKAVVNEEFQNARTCSPALIEVTKNDNTIYEQELFGPIALIIKTTDTRESIRLAQKMAREHGAITCAAYTTDPDVEKEITTAMESVFTPVSLNLTGFIWVNQHAGFSDFHVTGGNPAGNASFTDPQFINRRFVWVGHRKAVKG